MNELLIDVVQSILLASQSEFFTVFGSEFMRYGCKLWDLQHLKPRWNTLLTILGLRLYKRVIYLSSQTGSYP